MRDLADNHHTAATAVEALRAELISVKAYCDLLKGALIDLGMTPPGRDAIDRLMDPRIGPQGRALLGMLFSRYPKVTSRWLLLDALPGREDRQIQIVGVTICRLRKVPELAGVILTVHHSGYVLSPEGYALLAA